MRLVWEEIAEYGGRQISVIHTLCSHSRHRASIGSCYLCCSDCRAARTPKWPAMTGMKEWVEGRRAVKHNPEEGAHFCTNNNSTSTVSSHASKWNKLSKTNESSEGIKVIAGDYPRFIWNDTALKTESLQMTCGYSIHHLYLIFGWSVKMSCINRKRWKLGAFGNSVLWGLISMPHQLANLKKAEIKTIELLIPTHLSPATVAIQSARLLSPKRRHLWRAMSHCILKNAHSQHRYCRLLWQWDGWFLPRSKTATVMPDRIRAVHESMTLKRLRATMERRECNYVYVALCIHIDSGVMGTSSCDCVSMYIYREGGVLEKNSDNFCSSFVLNTVNVKGRARAHTCVGEYDNLTSQGTSSCLRQGSHSIPHTWCREIKVLVWRKLF